MFGLEFYVFLSLYMCLVAVVVSCGFKQNKWVKGVLRVVLYCSLISAAYFVNKFVESLEQGNVITLKSSDYGWIQTSYETLDSYRQNDSKRVIIDYTKGCSITARNGPENITFTSKDVTFEHPGLTCEEALKNYNNKD